MHGATQAAGGWTRSPAERSRHLLSLLSIYEKVGIVSRDQLQDVPAEYDPAKIMPDFQSIVVLARVPKEVPKERVDGKFHYAIGTIAAQDSAVSLLKRDGYSYEILGSRSRSLSLPRLGERAGVGQLSPFRTLAVKGSGLRAVLSAIVTNAPLEPTPPVTDACPRPETCLRRCAALDENGVFDRTKCISCGMCVELCPNA